MNGIEEIIVERINQLDNHGYNVDKDVMEHVKGELRSVATALILKDYRFYPLSWDDDLYNKWMSEPRVKQLAIAGAFIAAEIDRIKELDERNVRLKRHLDKYFDVVDVKVVDRRRM